MKRAALVFLVMATCRARLSPLVTCEAAPRIAGARTPWSPRVRSPAIIEMIAITTSNSMREKAQRFAGRRIGKRSGDRINKIYKIENKTFLAEKTLNFESLYISRATIVLILIKTPSVIECDLMPHLLDWKCVLMVISLR
jgi:hypothetical protein